MAIALVKTSDFRGTEGSNKHELIIVRNLLRYVDVIMTGALPLFLCRKEDLQNKRGRSPVNFGELCNGIILDRKQFY